MSLTLLLLGCLGIPGLGGQAGEERDGTDADLGDSGALGGDTAADTGDEAEDDDNLDAGFHEGTVHVDFYGGDTLVGACDGTAAVDVDDDGGLSGSATCTLEGNDDVLELSIEGSEDGGTISSPADSWTWTGTTADGVLHGAWEGEDGGGIRHVGFFDVGAD